MIDYYGHWKANKDYSDFQEKEWCDLDYVASWIKEKGYQPKTSIENLCWMILNHYDFDEEKIEKGYFAIKDERAYPDNLMVYIPDVECYVEASGGIAEFDYDC
jgi:hypothetical protein